MTGHESYASLSSRRSSRPDRLVTPNVLLGVQPGTHPSGNTRPRRPVARTP